MENSSTNNPVVLPSKFKVRLEMKSDWHIGTGAGRPGSIDKLLARDAEGCPFVPAKTINGIWRDAMETLTLGLDNGKEGDWSKWVETIFGIQPTQLQLDKSASTQAEELHRRVQSDAKTYSHSLLSLQPARLSANLRGKIDAVITLLPDKEEQKRQRQKLLAAMTFIKPGVSIDDKTGTAITDFLRFEEMGRVGTVLEAECELKESSETISALLLLSAMLVERIGGKRRRGAGLCALKVCDEKGKEIPPQDAIKWLEKNKTAPNVPLLKNNEEKFSLSNPARADEWQTLEFSLRLQTPVSIVTATLGNVSESLDFIPGTYLLPHITNVLRNKLGDKIFQAVAYGDLQILPATLEISQKRGLPAPRVLAQHKVEGGFEKKNTVYNKLAKEIKDTTPQLKPFRSGYVTSLDENGKKLPSYKNTPKTLLMHNTVEDKYQRPTENVGGVYSREAIAAGTTLCGEIRLRKSLSDELGTDWWTELKLNGAVRLGTSRKDDYGLVELNISPPQKFSSSATLKGNRLTVYLQSDCLLRNTNLRQTNLVAELAKELSSQENLNVTLKPIQPSDKETTSLVMTRRIESWHEGWGFPRPTLIGIEAGSCVVFEIENFTSLDDQQKATLEKNLQTIEAAGIGERRGEGYGQVRFNPPLLTQPINGWDKADKPENTKPLSMGAPEELSDEEKTFAELIEEIAWREELKVAVLKIADDKEQRNQIFGFDGDKKEPPMSQIGGLRSAITRLQEEKDKTIVINWLEHLKATSNRREKWAKDKAKAEAKLNKIIKLLEPESRKQKPNDEPQNVWEWLEGVFNQPPTLVRGTEELQKKLWAEAVRALFDACARAHKRELEKKGDN
jgi:CRISPR-associated protein Csx10